MECWANGGPGIKPGATKTETETIVDIPTLTGDGYCRASEIDVIAILGGGGTEIGWLDGLAGLGFGVVIELAEDAIVGDRSREIGEVKLGETPGEEFFAPQRDSACGEFDASLARRS